MPEDRQHCDTAPARASSPEDIDPDLPDDCLRRVFDFLPGHDLAKAATVCGGWRAVIDCDLVWEGSVDRDYVTKRGLLNGELPDRWATWREYSKYRHNIRKKWTKEPADPIMIRGVHIGDVDAIDIVGDMMVTGGRDRQVKMWDLAESTPTYRSDLGHFGHDGWVWDVKIWNEVVITTSWDGCVKVWALDEGGCMHTFKGHQSAVLCATRPAPHSRRLYSGSFDKTIREWNLDTGDAVNVFSGHKSEILSVTCNPDESVLVSSSADKSVKVWDLRSGREVKDMASARIIKSIVWGQDDADHLLYTGGTDERVKVFDTRMWKRLEIMRANGAVHKICVDKDHILSCSSKSIQLFRNGNSPMTAVVEVKESDENEAEVESENTECKPVPPYGLLWSLDSGSSSAAIDETRLVTGAGSGGVGVVEVYDFAAGL